MNQKNDDYIKDKNIQSKEMQDLYSSILKQIFENVNYYISKKNPNYQDVFDKTKLYLEKLSKDYELNADKYFPILAKSITVENYKLGKYLFPNLKLLIKNNFLLGLTPINYLELDIQSLNNNSNNKKRRMIDLIVDSLTSADSTFEDDDIWFMLIECIVEIINNKNMINNLIGETFKKVYTFLYRMNLKFDGKKEENGIIKINLEYFIKNSFQELNFYINFDKPKIEGDETNQNTINTKTDNNIENSNNSNLMNIYNNLSLMNYVKNYETNEANPLDLLVSRMVKTMVDTICFRATNKESIKNIIPLVPKSDSDFYKPVFRKIKFLQIMNENNFVCGFFGWCYICRKTANFYAINHRVPICSFSCKYHLCSEEKQLNNLKENFVNDCPLMLKYFSQILSNKITISSKSDEVIKQKLFSLEIISFIFENYSLFIYNQRRFIKVIKENLMEGLFKTCLSNQVEIYSLSVSIFFMVFKYFKEHLKPQINYFIENVFLKILNNNSSFLSKKVILQNLNEVNYMFFLELYANYDCELNEKFTIKNLIIAISNIVQTRYSKNPQNYSTQEYDELIKICINIILSMVQSIYEICEKKYPLLKNSLNNELSISRLSSVNNEINVISPNPFHYTQVPTEVNVEIESNLKKKYELQTAASKFNIKTKAGLEYLKSVGYINDSDIDSEAKDIMLFFRNTPFLKKKNIGEFLGENTDLSIKTLKYFAESFDFKNMDIVQALKLFLSTFQLPAEGQIIDRVIEHFASKYYNDNPSLFSNADSAFYLSYCIILLQTEIYNPNIKDKMTLERFMQLLEDQNKDGKLKEEYLSDIYRQVLEEPLSVPEIEEDKDKIDKEKNDIENAREKQRLINGFNYNSKIKQNREKLYLKLNDNNICDYISQFMSSLTNPLFSMFNIIIEQSEDSSMYNPSIIGISYCIKILGLLNLETHKQNIISNLCTMTNLLQVKIPKEKNILCIKELLTLANSDYRYCKGSWNFILEIINKLYYYLTLISMPKDERELFYKNKKQSAVKTNIKKNILLMEETISIEKETMKILSKEINLNHFEKIMTKTLNFDSSTLIEFVNSMCDIAKFEFKNNGLSKIFFLQKIVEIAELNLFSRPRFNWNNTWKILSEFFVEIGCSKDNENSINAIDSLRQLALKFLQKKEGENYHFQKEFLMPFLDTWKKCGNIDTQEYIIVCINNLLRNETRNIKSGWEVVFSIFKEVAFMKEEQNLQKQIIDILSYISKNNYNEVKEILKDFTSCLILFIFYFPDEILDIIKNFFKQIEDENNYYIILNLYKPFIIDNNEQVREKGLNNLIDCINSKLKNPNSNIFVLGKKERFWEFILIDLLIPIAEELILKITIISNSNRKDDRSETFSNSNDNNDINENIKYNTEEKNKEIEKLSLTLENLLILAGNLFNEYFFYNYKFLGKYFEELENIVFYCEEKVQKAGLDCIKFLNESEKMKNMSFLRPFIFFLTKLVDRSLEKDLLDLDIQILKYNPNQYKEILDINISNCYIHLNILSLLDKIIEQYIDILGEEDLNKILDCFENSFDIAIRFNNKIELRLIITENLKVLNILALFKQLSISIKNFYFILEHLFNDNNSFQSKQNYYDRIIETSIRILKDYAKNNSEYYEMMKNNEEINRDNIEVKEKEKLIKSYNFPICNNIFPIIQKILFFKFDKYKKPFTKSLLDLIICEDENIRGNVKILLASIYNQSALINPIE